MIKLFATFDIAYSHGPFAFNHDASSLNFDLNAADANADSNGEVKNCRVSVTY